MKYLILGSNQLSGTLPPEITNLRSLYWLDLSDNSFTGELPSFERWTEMNTLWMNKNDFRGTFPSSVGRMTSLRDLRLYGNSLLTGTLPASLFDLYELVYLIIHDCSFGGTLSADITGLVSLQQLYLGKNNFYGSLPEGISAMTDLTKVSLEGNAFTGTALERFCVEKGSKALEGEVFVADCAPDNSAFGTIELECSCCTECCRPGGGECLPTR